VWEPAHIDPKWVKTGVANWQGILQKLRLFELTQFDRVCFMDGDTVLQGPMDDVFEDPAVIELQPTLDIKDQIKDDEAALPAQYLLAARPESGFPHDYPQKAVSVSQILAMLRADADMTICNSVSSS
jgi:hypothetical protein